VATGEGAPIGPPVQRSPQDVVEESKAKLEFLEERLRAIERGGSFGFGDIAGLCLVSDLVIPPKFKVLEFEKYKGTSYPRNHLTMYCRKMAAHARDEKLLMHFFQDNLVDTTLSWYMRLELARIRSWNDLVDAFLKQYKYNVDMAPDRLQLQNMSKKNSETFKEYAQRWRELVAQVESPLHDREMVTMFMSTLQSPFCEHMLGSVSSNFVDIVIIGERIELGWKTEKIAQGSSTTSTGKKFGFNSSIRKESDGQVASTTVHYPSTNYKANTTPGNQQHFQVPRPNWKNEGGSNFN